MADIAYKPPIEYKKEFETSIYKQNIFNYLVLNGTRIIHDLDTAYTVPDNKTFFLVHAFLYSYPAEGFHAVPPQYCGIFIGTERIIFNYQPDLIYLPYQTFFVSLLQMAQENKIDFTYPIKCMPTEIISLQYTWNVTFAKGIIIGFEIDTSSLQNIN